MCGDYRRMDKQTHVDKYALLHKKRSLMPLDKPRFLVPWTYSPVIISCH
jgi:hypothetical protein